MSSLVNFISETILLGFKAGAALTIAMTQLPKLFGVKGGGEDFFERIVMLGGQLPETNLAVLAFGLAALVVLLLGEKFLPGRPIALLVVVASIVVLSVTPLADLGLKVVGALPTGLPDFHLPGLRLRDVDGVIPWRSRACCWRTWKAFPRHGRWRRRAATKSIRARSCSAWARRIWVRRCSRPTRWQAACRNPR